MYVYMYILNNKVHLPPVTVKAGGNFVVLDLNPASWYNLKVTAHNNAGFSVAEYEFATLTVTGGKWTLLFSIYMYTYIHGTTFFITALAWNHLP